MAIKRDGVQDEKSNISKGLALNDSLGPVMVDLAGLELSASDETLLSHPGVGGVVLFARNYASRTQVTDLVSAIHAVRVDDRGPLVVAVDQEGGRVQRFVAEFTAIPAQRSVGALFDATPEAALAAADAMGTVLGCELASVGIDVNFAPVVDLDAGNEKIIGTRAFHRQPEAVARLAGALLSGMKAQGVHGVAKHFPGHGATDGDTHVEVVTDPRALDAIDATDLVVYRALAAAGLRGVMTAHVVYPQVDPLPASFSKRWLSDILRQTVGFEGVVMSDDLSMDAARGAGFADQLRAALDAGCDVVLSCNDREQIARTLDDPRCDDLWSRRSRLELLRGERLGDGDREARLAAAHEILGRLAGIA